MSAAQPHASGSSEPAQRMNANSLMSRNSSSGTANGSGSNNVKPKRKPGKSRGRKMMIKIFYSLQSPRLGSSSTPSAPTPSSNAPSPDFFSVLDPSLSSASTAAASPVPPPPPVESQNAATNYSCMARLSAPVTVQIIGSKKHAGEGSEDKVQFGRVTLKTVLSAICISRPELVMDSTKDFSVSTVDPYEARRQPSLASSSTADGGSSSCGGVNGPGQGLVEGKGMLSWTLAEKKEGTTMVTGRITGSESEARRMKRRKGDDGNVVGDDFDEDDESDSGDETEETLEIWLQLSERDAFTQGQFLNCLRSYHNPIQQLQGELSESNSSPPKASRREAAPIPSSSSGTASAALGDPVKRRRPSDRQSLPLSASTTALPIAPASAFANQAPSASTSSLPAPSSTSTTASALPEPTLQNPDLLAFISQLVSSSASAGATAPNSSAPPLDLLGNQEALQNLARLCGLPVPEPALVPPPSTLAPTSTSGPAPIPSARPPKLATSTSDPAANSAVRKKREHFAAIDSSQLKGQGKNNPRDPNGCSNCKRKKSTVWREGLGLHGLNTTVCNACGTFFNKNGYHRTKGGADHPTSNSARQLPSDASTSTSRSNRAGRPLTGRLTATCEADLSKRKARKKVANASPDSSSSSSRIFGGGGIIPPLSPSKHVGPRSPGLAFGFSSSSRSGSTRAPGIMSSPGRSPRLRHRPPAAQGAAATSPLRAPADAFVQDGGFDFAALFGGHASPSPRKRTLSGNNLGGSGEKGVPNYLLTASPGTALDRILNETNIGALSSLGEPMQVDGSTGANDPNPFNFFLQPGSPSREQKENERPRASTVGPASTTVEAPVTDADSFESVLSSLRRDFNNRLSSNALTAPSSPVPSSPCVQPRTSTATPGSKGKAPLSSGRAAPSIFDSFTDQLVTGIAHDAKDGGGNSRTPHSDSDAWSPRDGPDNEDRTLTFGALLSAGDTQSDAGQGERGGPGAKSRPDDQYNYDLSHLLVPNKINGSNSTTRRAAFIPSHLVPASDATDFDLGSLPPSSPPQLPSETFPTPSDFDGVTPGTEGGEHDERDRLGQEEQERWTIEAVAEKVATEPDEEARATIMSLLQSVGSEGAAVELPGVAGVDKVTLDRSTVDKLLSLISAKPSTSASSRAAPSQPAATSLAAPAHGVVKVESAPQESPDLSQIDFFNNFGTGPQSQQQQELHHSEQMNGLYSDLFSHTQF
ncbi:hypothetical protein JCM11491_003081 [Sporobolomyces phaffii]